MIIKILGSGCKKCVTLGENAKAAADAAGKEAQIIKVTDFAEIAASGTEMATAEYGHSVHAIVTLEPGQWFYRFVVGSYVSPVGITQAAPAIDVPVASVRFAAASCQDYSDGYYAAHRDIAEQAPDFVVWLGDYIYESGQSSTPTIADRTHLGAEPTKAAKM